MFGSGVATGMPTIHHIRRQTLKVLGVGPTACTVAVAGTTTPGSVARRIVSAASRRTATTTLACGWPFEFATTVLVWQKIHIASHSRVLCSKLPRDWHCHLTERLRGTSIADDEVAVPIPN